MKKQMNRISSILLSLAMIIALMPAAFAADVSVSTAMAVGTEDVAVQYKIKQSLMSILSEKEHYGLDRVDMNALFMGKNIPAYEVVNEKLQPLNISFYPIFDNAGNIVIMAAAVTVGEEISISLANTFVNKLNALGKNDKVAFIYDNSGMYLLVNDELTKLANDPDCAEMGRGSIKSLTESELYSVCGTFLEKNVKLPDVGSTQRFDDPNGGAYLNVPLVLQPSGSDICWAACVACIVNYKTGSDYSAQEMADEASCNTGYPTTSSTQLLWRWCPTYRYKSNVTDAFSYILTSLQADNPVFGDFIYLSPDTGAHAMVIRGVHVYYKTFSVMDPLDTNESYRTGSVQNVGSEYYFTITNWTGGKTLQLRYYVYSE